LVVAVSFTADFIFGQLKGQCCRLPSLFTMWLPFKKKKKKKKGNNKNLGHLIDDEIFKSISLIKVILTYYHRIMDRCHSTGGPL
jgi:hypothetical protein